MLAKCVLSVNQRLGGKKDKIEHLSSYAYVVHTTAEQVISCRGKNENVCEMFEMNNNIEVKITEC